MKPQTDASSAKSLHTEQKTAEPHGQRMYTSATTSQDTHTEMGQTKANPVSVGNDDLIKVNNAFVLKYEFKSECVNECQIASDPKGILHKHISLLAQNWSQKIYETHMPDKLVHFCSFLHQLLHGAHNIAYYNIVE